MTEPNRILVVDDEEAIRLFLAEELSQEGYVVTTAASGEEALARLEAEPVDLILLDLRMGGIDGLQVMEEVKRRPLPPVVIMLTAYASLDSAITAMRHGGDDYLVKPCRTEKLLASVEKGLAKRRQELQQEELVHLIEESARRLRVAPTLEEKGREELSQKEIAEELQQTRVAPTLEEKGREELSQKEIAEELQQTRVAPALEEKGREERRPIPPRFLQARGLLLDKERLLVTLQGRPLDLTPAEFMILACLMEQPNQLVTYRQLAQALHGYEGELMEVRDLLTHLWRLRRKLGTGHDGLPYIINVMGQGYMLVSEEESEAK